MRKDLITDRFWKFWEIPNGLVRLGHACEVVVLSYRQEAEGVVDLEKEDSTGPSWFSVNLGKFIVPGLIEYSIAATRRARRADLILACSDSIYGVFAGFLAWIYKKPWIFELYDNFEGFSLMKIPGMRMLYRSAIRSATGVVVYSKELETLVRENYARRGPLITITSGVEKDLFRPLDKLECRRQLNLPTQRKLIGAAGTLSEIKNTQVLIEAFQALAKTRDDIILVLAGALGSDFSIPKDPRIIYLGELAHEEIALFLNSLDLAVICYKESPCGQTAYPTRIMEAIACQVPFVCADVGSFRTILENDPQYLFSSNDKIDLMRAIEAQISDPSRFEMDQKSWHEYIKELEAFILACCDANHARAA